MNPIRIRGNHNYHVLPNFMGKSGVGAELETRDAHQKAAEKRWYEYVSDERPVVNRTVTLRDTWAKVKGV